MKTRRHGIGRKLLAALLGAALLAPASSVGAWWGPGGPVGWGWDPHEAYMHEYGFDHPYGPTPADFRRISRDNWRAWRGYPVRIDNVGPLGPTYNDVVRQNRRKMRHTLGYWY